MPRKIVSKPKRKTINLQNIRGINRLGPGAVMFVKDQCDCADATFCDCDERPGGMRINPAAKARVRKNIKMR